MTLSTTSGPVRVVALLVLAGLLAGACGSARGPGAQGASPVAMRVETSASLEPEVQTCEERVREERKTEIIRAGVNTGILTGAWMVLYSGAQGAFWGLVSGTRDGAWIGAAVGASLGLVVGVVSGIEAARQVKGQLAYAPPACLAEASAPVAVVAPLPHTATPSSE